MDYISVTQKQHKKLCEVFELEYQPIEFEPVPYDGCVQPEPWNKGTPHTEEYKKHMREVLLKVAPMKGVKHTKEAKEKIKQKRKEQIFSKESIQKRNKNINKSIQTPNGLFESRGEAAKYYDVDPTAVNYWLKTKPTEYYYIKKVKTL
jgi:hypothetical protein